MNFLNKTVLIALFVFVPHLADAATTIAVPDLGYKEEVRTFFYYEASSSHTDVTDTFHSNIASSHVSAAGSYTGKNDSSYVKNYYDQIHVSYGELRGMASEIRALLIKNGFNILNTSPHLKKTKQQDDFFDINKRIKAGEFKKSQYVLYGVIVSMDYQKGVEPLAGTNTQMNIHALNMTVDFNLIDTTTLKTAAAFTVFANANDNKLGAGSYPPSVAKIVAQLGKNLSEEVTAKLAEQGIISRSPVSAAESPLQPQGPIESPVIVYKPD